MAEDWSLEEVEATVADYFDMLDKELRGLEYNKTAHRRYLSSMLNNRSHGSVEFKHQNISAVLIRLGFPYISGYKPRGNYQKILFETVSNRLKNYSALIKYVEKQVDEPATVPVVNDILKSLVKPPVPVRDSNEINVKEPREPFLTDIDYLAREAKNQSLGSAGEEFVIRFEQARLIHAGQERMASKIEHISKTRGDSAGYDILSFETTGQERLIEVKTTAYGPLSPFFVTRNEVDVSFRNAPGYYLYRTFNFRHDPKLFTKKGPLDRSFKLDPMQYVASLG